MAFAMKNDNDNEKTNLKNTSPKNLGSKVSDFVIIDRFVASFLIPFCPLEVLKNG